jgi:hypothetical protein
MKNPTSSEKWLMSLNIGGEYHRVLFDGKIVYDSIFPYEIIMSIKGTCGHSFSQEILASVCSEKMKDMKVVMSAFDGTWAAEDKNTPFTCSIASETYWSS